jgi:hypothetical protein
VSVEIRVLGPGDETLLRGVAPDVFDDEVDPRLTAQFLQDPRHHLAVAVEASTNRPSCGSTRWAWRPRTSARVSANDC